MKRETTSSVIGTPSILGLAAAELISSAGTAMTWIAIPWFALQATWSPFEFAVWFRVQSRRPTTLASDGASMAFRSSTPAADPYRPAPRSCHRSRPVAGAHEAGGTTE